MYKVSKIQLSILFIYLFLIFKYISSLGLMDDFYYTSLNFFLEPDLYVKFISGDISSGGFRPFLPIQITLNNFGFYLFSYKGYFIFNLVYLFVILEIFYFTFNKLFNLNKPLFYLLFFCWPYSTDLIIHPSLQEKYIILFISLFVYVCLNTNNKLLLACFIALSIPFVKIQALTLFPIIYSVANSKLNKNYNKSILLSSYLISSVLILGIFYLQPRTYFNSGFQINGLIERIINSEVNIVNLLLIFVTSIGIYYFKILNFDILVGFIISNILLILFMSAYKPVGNYLNSINIFFIILYLLVIYNIIFDYLKSEKINISIQTFSFVLFFIVLQSFTIPRFERMNSINDVITYSDEKSAGEIYYSCLEGVQYLNKIQDNNKFIHLDNYMKVSGNNIVFLSDSFECNNIETELINNCLKKNVINFKYENSMRLTEYEC